VTFPSAVRSLAWAGDGLVDLVGGCQQVTADGAPVDRRVNWAFGFDRAIVASSGSTQILYMALGTKAAVVAGLRVVSELNRSFYCSDSFEYPITVFALRDGRQVIAHCPDEYNRLELEEPQAVRRVSAGRPGGLDS
jgi:hypothetical protein